MAIKEKVLVLIQTIMSSLSFPEQIKSSLISICQLLTSCIQHYALHCNTDGHFSQVIFGADLVRYSSTINCQLLVNQLILFEEHLGTYVKTLTFFIRDCLLDRSLSQMKIPERRLFLLNIYQKLYAIEYIAIETNRIRKDEIDMELLTGHILDTLPREVFDRKGVYQQLLVRLIQHNIDRIDDYLLYNQQLSFITLGSCIEQSRLIDGILLPIHNSHKLLSSFLSNNHLTIVFLNIQSTEFDKSSCFSIIDHNQQFFSYDTLIYRQFIQKHLTNVNLIISSAFINETFLFEFHQMNINVIDAIDEQTFEFLLKVYQCSPCDRLIMPDDEAIDRVSTILLDRHVMVDQQAYIYLSSNGSHQTLLTCVPTPTLISTTRKILINTLRLLKFILQQFQKTSSLPVATETEYLKFLAEQIPELRHIFDHRCIHLDRISSSSQVNSLFPICIYREYLLNGIDFLCYIHKIDGVYSTTRKAVVENC